MNLKNFEKIINQIILERGYDYFHRGAVTKIYKTKTGYGVEIKGTETYDVIVDLDSKQNITFSACDCPYDKGPYCKHQAAAFYALRNELEIETPSLDELLQRMTKEQLIEIIMYNLRQDDDLEDRVEFLLPKDDEVESSRSYIQQTVNKYQGYDNFISYYDMPHFVSDLEVILEKVEKMQNSLDAVEIALVLLEEAVETIGHSDDSSGELGFFIQQVLGFIEEVVEREEVPSIKEELFEAIFTASKAKAFINWPDPQISLLTKLLHFCDNIQLKDRLQQLLQQLIESSDNSFYHQQLKELQVQLLPKEEVMPFLYVHRSYANLRKILVAKLMVQKDYPAVIELTLEGEKESARWKPYRYAAYKAMNRKEEQKALAEELLLQGDFDYYLDLKEMGDLDYQALLNKLKSQTHWYARDVYVKVILHENDLPELFNFVKRNPHLVEEYGELLLANYQEDVFNLYEVYIKNAANNSSNRNEYRKVCGIIRHYAKIAGRDTAQKIINELVDTYKRRPAFIDELGKV